MAKPRTPLSIYKAEGDLQNPLWPYIAGVSAKRRRAGWLPFIVTRGPCVPALGVSPLQVVMTIHTEKLFLEQEQETKRKECL